jgi:hypothetical protein
VIFLAIAIRKAIAVRAMLEARGITPEFVPYPAMRDWRLILGRNVRRLGHQKGNAGGALCYLTLKGGVSPRLLIGTLWGSPTAILATPAWQKGVPTV